jgi:hypothetical protein
MKYTYYELIEERPEPIKTIGQIEYVQNPWRADQPIIALNRAEKTAVDTNFFIKEELE